MPTIKLKRGTNSGIGNLNLDAGEPAFVTDTGKLYIGDGTNKVLINPINAPVGIDTNVAYPKVQVNQYGQVVGQSTLSAIDIPNIATSQINGLGTCATINTGTSSGQIPTLDSGGKFPTSTIPDITVANNAYVYYSGNNVSVSSGNFIPLNNITSNGTAFSLNENGSVKIQLAGTYMFIYNMTSATTDSSTALALTSDSGYFAGTACRIIGILTTPFTSCQGTLIRTISTEENIGIKNIGLTGLSVLGGHCSISINKIG